MRLCAPGVHGEGPGEGDEKRACPWSIVPGESLWLNVVKLITLSEADYH